ncbi:PSP1-like protein [Vairimorpha necatrix]|uniref:PSP1-like protein n=1 Tax=Vairimorpha necatrix TaxID=6039 RepID=A0AAX4JA72_9MICR
MKLYANNTVWMENEDTWNDKRIKCKAIGEQFTEKSKEVEIKSDKLINIMKSFMTETFLVTKVTYHIIEYKSGRLDIGFDYMCYTKDSYVILEADRGEDCGKVLSIASECKLSMIFETFKEATSDIESKRILRYATDLDVQELKRREIDEINSLEKCKELVFLSNITMDILSCEYQWDKKKITFYFKSSRRIDFRDLLKDLFKLFKIRIWLCAENKSFNAILARCIEN